MEQRNIAVRQKKQNFKQSIKKASLFSMILITIFISNSCKYYDTYCLEHFFPNLRYLFLSIL